jgi:fatty acid desaturase
MFAPTYLLSFIISIVLSAVTSQHAPLSWYVTRKQAIILQWLFLFYLNRADRDFGLGQIDAVRDHVELAHNPFIVLVTFGEHCLHHLFPTIDHTNLHHFYPIFHETCREFGVKYKPLKVLQLCKGQFQMLAKNKPNPIPPQKVMNWLWNDRTVAQLVEAVRYKCGGGRFDSPCCHWEFLST